MFHIKEGDHVRFLGIKDRKGNLLKTHEQEHIGVIGVFVGKTEAYDGDYPMECRFPNVELFCFRVNEIEPVDLPSDKLEDYL